MDGLLGGGELGSVPDDVYLEEVGCHIQENLEDDIVREALKSGVDLRQYSKEIEHELLGIERASIRDYVNSGSRIAELHQEIEGCDSILQKIERILQSFQNDLNAISSEIQNLQDQSIEMNVQLKNRQAVRGELSQFLDEMVITEQMINHISDTAVTERQFLEQLHELNHKINFAKEQSFKDARSFQDVCDILEKLKLKAIGKIRHFLLQKIISFRKPMSNYQVAQNAMLKFRFYNEFLLAHDRTTAKEIRDEYIETTSKMYYSYFKTYSSKLLKLQVDSVADKDDLLGVEDSRKSGLFSSRSSQMKKMSKAVFSLGNRGSILTTDLESAVIVPHTAGSTKYLFECLFRSLHFALLDNCCREYLFNCDFFMVAGQAAQDLFNLVMGKTLHALSKQMETCISECHDGIALIICIQVVLRYKVIMQRRGVGALDNYWDLMLQSLWPRWQSVMEANISSVSGCDPTHLSGSIDVRPHFLTRRYAEFAAAILSVCVGSGAEPAPAAIASAADELGAEGGPGGLELSAGAQGRQLDQRVQHLLSKMQGEVENFLIRMSEEFPHRKEQLIFLLNNYDMMLSVITERAPEETVETTRFKEVLNVRSAEFIEEILAPYFGSLMGFVKEVESRQDPSRTQISKNEEARVIQIIKGFNMGWKSSIDRINQEIMSSFTNFKNGTQIFQGALTQLIQYYHRLQKVMSLPPYKSMNVRNELINIHHIMVEIKKLKPTY